MVGTYVMHVSLAASCVCTGGAVAPAAAPAGLADADAGVAAAVAAGVRRAVPALATRAVPQAPPHLAVVAAQPRRAAALVHAFAAPAVQTWDHALCWNHIITYPFISLVEYCCSSISFRLNAIYNTLTKFTT